MENDRLIFQEVQRFRNVALWAVFAGSFALVAVFCGYGAFLKPLSETLWRELPDPMKVRIIAAGLAVVFFSGMLGVLLQAKLITEVRPDGLYIRWYPLHFSMQKIPLENVERIEALTYRPIKDYRGWGIRKGCGGKAYNIHGDRGVRINYANGSHVLIGSQNPAMLAEAIESLMKQA
jgi:hypothetical protein